MSRSEPKRRPSIPKPDPGKGDPVRVSTTDDETVLGVVQSIVPVRDRQNVCVQTEDGELVTMGERVELVTGVDAREAQQKAGSGDSD